MLGIRVVLGGLGAFGVLGLSLFKSGGLGRLGSVPLGFGGPGGGVEASGEEPEAGPILPGASFLLLRLD